MTAFRRRLLALCCVYSATVTAAIEWPLDSSGWRFSNCRNTSIAGTARVPGGVFADLLANGFLNEDPLWRYNDVEYRWVSNDDWAYTVTFDGNYDRCPPGRNRVGTTGSDSLDKDLDSFDKWHKNSYLNKK